MKLLFSLAFFPLICGVALACSCSTGPVESKFEAADKVFRGTIVAVDPISSRTNIEGVGWVGRSLIRAQVEIVSTYKGDTQDLIYVVTDHSNCSISMEVNDDYLFFTDEKAQTSYCAGSFSERTAHHFGVEWSSYVAAVEALR